MTVVRFEEEVEVTFDNGEVKGYINLEKEEDDFVLLNLDFSGSDTTYEDAETLIEVLDLKIPKKDLIEFLQKSLDMLLQVK